MESAGVRFGDIYNTNSGIATLSNKVYIFKPDKEKGDYLYMQDGTPNTPSSNAISIFI
jgi:hypothetical protein